MKPKIKIEKGSREYARHLFSEILLFGDHDVFGWTVTKSKIKLNIKEIKPR